MARRRRPHRAPALLVHGPQTGKRTPRPPRPGAAPARAIDAPHLAQGDGQSGGVAGARRREQGAVGQRALRARGRAKLRARESAHPGDAGVRVGCLERVHSSDGRAAAGLAAACAAQPAESWPSLQRSAVQAGNLRADTNAGGRVATVRCTGTHAALSSGQAMRRAPQVANIARRTRSAPIAPAACCSRAAARGIEGKGR